MELTEQGQIVYDRTYSRTKPDGTKETWPETVARVVDGNLALGDPRHELPGERQLLTEYIEQMKIVPAGRHLWASGVKGRQYLFNCWVAPWGDDVTEHFSFTFLRLMEGGGVGANYSNIYLASYDELFQRFQVHIVCDPEHPDYQKMKDAGLLSDTYDAEWAGAFEVEDSREGWAAALVDLIGTYYDGAEHTNRVYDVSRVRAEGARLLTFGGRASGPLPFARMMGEISDTLNGVVESSGYLTGLDAMEIDHAIAKCVVSGGNRRSARMSIMHWADSQIEAFIEAKKSGLLHWTTNISVEVDERFFERVKDEHHPGHMHARSVLRLIATGMLTNGEPGFWNSTYSNIGEPNPVISTNPCGEIALRESENCNLGHVNLAAFVDPENGELDDNGLRVAHRLITRFLIRATNGDVNDPRSRQLLNEQRRIGVGHLGVASFLAMEGEKYSEASYKFGWFRWLLEDLAIEVDDAARLYAHNLRIPVPVKTRTVAPTGTIAKLSGVSEGIHPIFSKYFIRRIRFSTVDPDQVATLADFERQGYHVEDDQYADMTKVVSLPTKDSLLAAVEKLYGEKQADLIVQAASDLSLEDMLSFQEFYQTYWADNAVSYTVNLDPNDYSVEDLEDAIRGYGPHLKGATVFPEMSLPQSPYERISKDDYALYEAWKLTSVSDGVDENCANGACPIK